MSIPTIGTNDPGFFDLDLHQQAIQVANRAIDHALTGPPALDSDDTAQHISLVDAPAGAGKTTLVVSAALAAHRGGARTLIITPGNAQVGEIAERLAAALAEEGSLAVLHRRSDWIPPEALEDHNLTLTADVAATRNADVVLATVDKIKIVSERLHEAGGFGLVIVDEAYQASAANTAVAVKTAPRLLAVGDPGQLEPFSSDPSHRRWTGHVDDPVQSLGAMLLNRHRAAITAAGGYQVLPLTRRLPASAATVLGRFYSQPVGAWARPGARQAATATGAGSEASTWVQAALNDGWAHVLLPGAATAPTTDAAVARAVAASAAAAVCDGHLLASEATRGRWEPLTAERVAVLVTYQQQRQQVEALLAELLPCEARPVVGTANTVQGSEFDATIVWHPLAGAAAYDGFRGATGPLAVMLSRHRHGCVVVGRASDREVFERGLPPVGEWDGTPTDSSVRGWFTHRAVFNDLAAHTLTATDA